MKGQALFFIIILILSGIRLSSQVVNIEAMRDSCAVDSLCGRVNLDLSANRNSINVFTISTGVDLYYKKDSSSWLFISQFKLIRAGQMNFTNETFAHIRTDRVLKERVKWEAFFQIQRNVLTNLDYRALLGTGPRFKLTDYNNARFYFGSLYMMELDKTNTPEVSNFHHRLSSYFSFSLYPQKDISYVSTTYLQPRIDQWNDYRIHTDNQLGLAITTRLKLNITFSLSYDADPPSGIPGLTYSFINGLSYHFD